MTRLRAVFAGLPAAVRHFVVLFAVAFVSAASNVITQAVVTAGGVTAVAWVDVLVAALNAGAVAGVGVATIAVTTFNTAYGRGSGREVTRVRADPADEGVGVKPGPGVSDTDPFHRPI